MQKIITFVFAVLPCVAFAELQSLESSELDGISAQSGITVEVLTASESDIYYVDKGASGGGIKLEGWQLVKTDPGTGAITTTSSSLTNNIDVTGADGGALVITSEFPANTAVKIDAVRLGSTSGGGNQVRNVINNTTSSAASLGRLNITGLSGQAVVTIKAR